MTEPQPTTSPPTSAPTAASTPTPAHQDSGAATPAPESPATPAGGLPVEEVRAAVFAALTGKSVPQEAPAPPAVSKDTAQVPTDLEGTIKALQAQIAELTQQVGDVKASALEDALARAGGLVRPEYKALVPPGLDVTTTEGKEALGKWISENPSLLRGKAPALPAEPVTHTAFSNPLYAAPRGSLMDQLKARFGMGG